MTNALRGFNMEITQANAQRVDDVYSELAANTASNVDEISTAMTKVASLANNANMEFETTAAFLAQIIETTRESAETAGTALKTVVARFSEVKKLIDQGTTKGTSEEGDIIDVNKVQAALRTAGIDMKQYFMGEVGLDDIFMELASKWDSLTTMQQRYIATQAAGSRQQSRFIALMSDYARTQELVGKAYNSTGASERQFEKTQESLESKLNRLKNAWNEFTMGLTNNVIVKGAVDVLTGLLNLVNKLTGAFGDGVGFILKWTAAFMAFKGLRDLFKTGGLLENSLLDLLSGTSLGNYLKKKVAESKVGEGAGIEIGESLFSGIKKASEHVWGSFGSLGEQITKFFGISGLSNTALAITGIATALLAVAAAAAAAQVIYSKWLKNTDAGRVKLTENYATSMQHVAESLQEQAKRAKEAKQKIEDYTNTINNADTSNKRNETILAQNDYITQLLKEDATYAQYIQQVTSQDGQIYLTLDSKALAKAVDTIAKGALEASALSHLADAINANARIAQYNNQLSLSGMDLANGTITRNGSAASIMSSRRWYELFGMGPGDYGEAVSNSTTTTTRELTNLEKIVAASITANMASAQIERQAYLLQAGTEFTNLYAPNANLDTQQANLVASAFADSFHLDEATDQLVEQYSTFFKYLSRPELLQQYQSLYGVAADSGISTSDLANAVAMQTVNKAQAENTTKGLTDLVKTDGGRLILEVFSGVFEGAEKYLTPENLRGAYASLSHTQRKVVQNMLSTNAEGIDQALTDLGNNFNKAVTDDFVKTIGKSLTGGSKTNPATLRRLRADAETLTKGQQKQLTQIVKNFSDYGSKVSKSIYEAALTNMQNPDEATTSFLDELNNVSDNPVLLFQAINKEASDAQSPVLELANTLKNDISDNPAFSKSNQLQFFLTSGEFEQLSEQIDKFAEEYGQITSENIDELVASSATLSALLNNNVTSASGLANILNALGRGEINIFDLDDAVIELYNDFYDLSGIAERAQATINNFKFGGGEAQESSDFIQSIIDKLKDLQSIGAYGDMNKYIGFFTTLTTDAFKTTDALDEFIKKLDKLNKNGGASFWTELFGLKIDKKGNMDMSNMIKEYQDWIANNLSGGEKGSVNFSNFLKQKIADNLGIKPEQVTQEWIDQIMNIFRGHDKSGDDLKDIAKTQMQGIIDKYIQGTEEGSDANVKEKIRASIVKMAQNSQLSEEEIKAIWKEALESKNIEYTDEDINFDFSNVDIGALLETSLQQACEAAGIEIKPEWFKGGADAQGAMLAALGLDKDGNFNIETLTANVGKVVPEVADGTLTAEEWINQIIAQNGGEPIPLPVKYQVVTQDDTGFHVADQETTLNISNLEDVQTQLAALDDFIDFSEANTAVGAIKDLATEVATAISNWGNTTKLDGVGGTLDALQTKANALATTISGMGGNIKIDYSPKTFSIQGTGDTSVNATFTVHAAARGGLVKSAAKGTFEPGLALTGEEKPEIIWNGEKGYAYLAGKNGPEINNLQPGDRVFNGEETAAILRRSGISSFAKGGKIHSYLSWGTGSGPTGGGTGRGTGNKKQQDLRNELDWLYNLVADIAEYERKANIISLKYEAALHDNTKTGIDLYNLLKKELTNLEKAVDDYNTEYKKRAIELEKLNKAANKDLNGKKDKNGNYKQNKYVRYNENDNTVEIDWDAINKLTSTKGKSDKQIEKDKETYDKIIDYINQMESAKQKRDNAEQRILEIQEQMRELRDQLRKSYADFENRVLDAVVASRQAQIDSLSELNDNINDVNNSILNSIQKEIELQRQIRDNTDTESNISDIETQIAFLQRDTTGANRTQILDLEKQLKEARQDYSDTLLDQSLDRLNESNEQAREQREKQIELMQAQLDYQKENGLLWKQVHDLINGAYIDGAFNTDSELSRLLQTTEGYSAMTEAQRKGWADELNATVKEARGYLEQLATESIDQSEDIRKIYQVDPKKFRVNTNEFSSIIGQSAEALSGKTNSKALIRALSNEEFIRIADLGNQISKADASLNNIRNSNSAFNIEISVGSLANDYDVDKLVKRIKEDIYTSAAYRNVNGVTILR